jgi:16S rRNA U516 pseudouridylate synthase RsuA-like enzyme
MLNRHGVQVYGKMICTEDDTYPAFVLVDKSRERQVRRFFAALGILL